jgi:iron complex transport system substrate-binding protein
MLNPSSVWRSPAVAIRLALLFCLLALGAGASAAPFALRDDRGTEHRFDAPPQRIITLLPSLTESVAVLGGGPRLVGVDRYSNWPAELAALPRLGGLDDALIEAIATLRPDVVLASTSARSIDRLEALGFKVLRLKSETHADVRRTLSVLAQLLGTPDEGERLWARLQREIAAAAQRVPPALKGQRVYFEVGGGPYAAGRSSFIGETLSALGMDNIVPADLGPFPKLNPEYVVRARPDLVMGVAREQAALLARPGWGSIPALAHKRLCAFDTARYEMMIRPGPRLGEAAAAMADCLAALAPR